MSIDDLPKINQRKRKSKLMQNELMLMILDSIDLLKEKRGYEFESYEIDNVLLGMIKRNHESYIKNKLGGDTE